MREFKQRGWSVPGYHYVVFPDGKVESLLSEDKVSNGVQGYNSTAINIAYVGGVDSKLKPVDNRTQAQKDALYDLLFYLKQQYPNAHIMGHRDIWGKDSKKWKKWCPCFDAEAEYASLDEDIKLSKYEDAAPKQAKYTPKVPNSPVKPVSYIDKIKKLASWLRK